MVPKCIKKLVLMWTLVNLSVPVNAISSYRCSTIKKYVKEAKNQIRDEKLSTPPKASDEPMTINDVVEDYGDKQRMFEYIAERMNITDMSDEDRSEVYGRLLSCRSFQKLVSECRSSVKTTACKRWSPYRTFDGTCNNPINPKWGSLFQKFRRVMPPYYKGLKDFRESVRGGQLPDPRDLSLRIFSGKPAVLSPNVSNMFMFFGQFLTHDIVDTPLPKLNGRFLSCCPDKGFSYCSPIKPKVDDPFYSQHNVTCNSLTRHPPYPTCEFTKRVQFNSVPSFLDVHVIYGRNEEEAKKLKTNDGTGKLKTRESAFGSIPFGNKSEDDTFCLSTTPRERCLLAGDSRGNQHTGLMTLNTLFLREHNRMADELKIINPSWSGGRIYKVARKILGAKMQHIVYNEYLPVLLGEELLDRSGLRVGAGRVKNFYNAEVDPTPSSEFATVSFRLHSTIQSEIGNVGCSRTTFRNSYSNQDPIYEGCEDDYMSGMCKAAQKIFDDSMVEDVTNFLYSGLAGKKGVGVDLVGFDVKRGRDHGMAPYVDFVRYWSNEEIDVQDFDDFEKYMSRDKVQQLKDNYKDPRDVDAWVGMMMEEVVPGAVTVPTSLSLAVDQFVRMKAGDRFYYENEGLPNSFHMDQLHEIKKTSLAKLICDNTKVSSIQKRVFLQPSLDNPDVPCSTLQEESFLPWKFS